ncbi:MAG: hypothetical protein H0W33_14690 [Gammaproteobacteria bacterium]|nr:hypothetical protein [Gammaproteobacteria bacterium]
MNSLAHDRALKVEVLTWCLAAIFAAAGGYLAASGDIAFVAVVIGAFAGAFLLFKPSVSLWFVIIGGLVLAGVTQLYIPQFQFIRWSIGLLAAILGSIAVLDYLFRDAPPGHDNLPPIFWWMVAFIGVALISSALNYRDLGTFVYGFKGYFQVWGLFFAIVMMSWQKETVDRLPKVLIWIALIQLPFALHQYFFLVPARVHLGGGIVAEDVIAGTFGADAAGGGANAALSVLLIIAAAILTSLYKRKLLSPYRLLVCVLILLAPIFLNANRIALLYLILAYLMLFSREIFRHPAKAIVAGAFSAAVIVAIFWSYAVLLSRSDPSLDWQGFIAKTVEQNTAEDYGYGAYELNRRTAIVFWLEEHRNRGLAEILLGHGVGAAREGEGGVVGARPLAQREYAGLGIGLTTVSAMLWEVGVIGLAVLLCILWTAYRAAGRLARVHSDVPWRSAVFQGLQVGVAIFTVSLFHKRLLIFHLPYQTLFVLVLGYIGYWQVRAGERSVSVDAPVDASPVIRKLLADTDRARAARVTRYVPERR